MSSPSYMLSVKTAKISNPWDNALKMAPMAPANCRIESFDTPVFLVINDNPIVVFNNDILSVDSISQLIKSDFFQKTLFKNNKEYVLRSDIVIDPNIKINTVARKMPNMDLDENIRLNPEKTVYIGYLNEDSPEFIHTCVNKEVAQIVDPENSKDMIDYRSFLISLMRFEGLDFEPIDLRAVMMEGAGGHKVLSNIEEDLLSRYNKSTLRIADKETFPVEKLGIGLFCNDKIVAMCTSKFKKKFKKLMSNQVFMNFFNFDVDDNIEIGEFDATDLQDAGIASIVYIDTNNEDIAPEPLLYYFGESVVPLLLSCVTTETARILDKNCPDLGCIKTLGMTNTPA